MSDGAFDRLSGYLRKYYEAHRPAKGRRPKGLWGRTVGHFEVWPDHAEEMAARVLVHIADPTNHDPALHADGMDVPTVNYQELAHWRKSTGRTDRPNDAEATAIYERRRVEIWERVIAAFPGYSTDPLGMIPGAVAVSSV